MFQSVMKPRTEKLFMKIVDVLAKNGGGTDPLTIINCCAETIVKLHRQGETEKIPDLIDIISYYSSYVLPTPSLFEMLERLVKDCTSEMFGIAKVMAENIRSAQTEPSKNSNDESTLANFLIRNIHYKESPRILSKYFDVAALFNSADRNVKIQLLKRCFESLVGKFDVLEFLIDNSLSDREFLGLYLRHSPEVTQLELKTIIDLIPNDGKSSIDILRSLYAWNKKNQTAAAMNRHAHQFIGSDNLECSINARGSDNSCIDIISPKLVALTCSEVLDFPHKEPEIEEFVSVFSDLLIPHFISLIRSVNDAFLNENRFMNLLRNMMGYVKLENFIEIVGVSVSSHFMILKNASNVDLSIFFSFYRKSTDKESMGKLISCLPAFCNYCTDTDGMVGDLLLLIKELFENHRSIAANSLEKLVHSHKLNLETSLVLKNPIPREESAMIINAVKASDLFSVLLKSYAESNNNECDAAMELMVGLMDVDLSMELENAILTGSQAKVSEALKIMPFYVKKWRFNYDLVCEVLRLANTDEAKRAYRLLHAIYEKTQVPVCICDLLFTNSSEGTSSARNRISLLHTIYRKGCLNCKMESFADRFYAELLLCSKYGNIKCRSEAENITASLSEDQVFKTFVLNRISKTLEDVKLVNGAIRTAFNLLKHAGAEEDFINELFMRLADVCYSSRELVPEILNLFNFVIGEKAFKDQIPEINRILANYASSFFNKYFKELRLCVLGMRKMKYEISKNLHALLKMKNSASSNKNNEIQVLRNAS